MSRREQKRFDVPKDIQDKSIQQNIVIHTNKVAIVDTDILFHWALSFIDDNMSLVEAQKEAENVILNFENTLKAKGYVYFIKGRGNFRYNVATIKPYKGKRTGDKHKFYDEILEHMTNFRNCIPCNGIEADDMVSIFHSDKTVVCTDDKDAKQNAGDLYNFRKKTLTTISKNEAWRNLWMQVLTGDTVDNIPGLEGVGPAKAEKVLNDTVGAKDYPNTVLNAFIEKYGLIDGSDFFNENFQLIRMKSSSGAFIKEKYEDIFLLIDYLYDI